jgi:hypothetical protein
MKLRSDNLYDSVQTEYSSQAQQVVNNNMTEFLEFLETFRNQTFDLYEQQHKGKERFQHEIVCIVFKEW